MRLDDRHEGLLDASLLADHLDLRGHTGAQVPDQQDDRGSGHDQLSGHHFPVLGVCGEYVGVTDSVWKERIGFRHAGG